MPTLFPYTTLFLSSALREGFIPHWGPLWVAGRHFPAGSDARDFTIYAPGRYTVEGAAARIDGELLASGRVVELTRGTHRFEPAAAVSMGDRKSNSLNSSH